MPTIAAYPTPIDDIHIVQQGEELPIPTHVLTTCPHHLLYVLNYSTTAVLQSLDDDGYYDDNGGRGGRGGGDGIMMNWGAFGK